MTLLELNPQFFKLDKRKELGTFLKPGIDPLRGNWTDNDWEERECVRTYFLCVDTLSQADGVRFNIPNFQKIHLRILFEGRADNEDGKNQSHWNVSGTGYKDLTLTPSILTKWGSEEGKSWHGWVTEGKIVNA